MGIFFAYLKVLGTFDPVGRRAQSIASNDPISDTPTIIVNIAPLRAHKGALLLVFYPSSDKMLDLMLLAE